MKSDHVDQVGQDSRDPLIFSGPCKVSNILETSAHERICHGVTLTEGIRGSDRNGMNDLPSRGSRKVANSNFPLHNKLYDVHLDRLVDACEVERAKHKFL